MNKVFINGRFVNSADAKVPITDRGFLYGDGVFETMRGYAGVIFKLDMHVDRLWVGLKEMRIGLPCAKKRLRYLIGRSMEINKLKNAYIRVVVTRGEGRFGMTYKDEFTPNLLIVAKEFEGYPEWMHDRGISAKFVAIRQNEYSPIPRIKTMNFLPYILARFEAKDAGYDEAMLMNTSGYVAEAATSNIFAVKNGALVTPSCESGILPGITRHVIIGIARHLKMRVIEKRVTCRELICADEVFLTNSLAEVIPVIKIGPKRIGSGSPGEITKLLRISYQKEVIKSVVFFRSHGPFLKQFFTACRRPWGNGGRAV